VRPALDNGDSLTASHDATPATMPRPTSTQKRGINCEVCCPIVSYLCYPFGATVWGPVCLRVCPASAATGPAPSQGVVFVPVSLFGVTLLLSLTRGSMPYWTRMRIRARPLGFCASQVAKPTTESYRSKNMVDGLTARCKGCQAASRPQVQQPTVLNKRCAGCKVCSLAICVAAFCLALRLCVTREHRDPALADVSADRGKSPLGCCASQVTMPATEFPQDKQSADSLTAHECARSTRARKGDANDAHALDNAAPDAAEVLFQLFAQEAGGVGAVFAAASDAPGTLL
jgi:hypothetical protein